MKTCKNLFLGFFSALLLTAGLAGCKDDNVPAANTQLSYPAGEMALGGGTYTSARPTVRSLSTPDFAVTRVTHNGTQVDAAIASIVPQTGVISITPGSDISALGNYLVSVRVSDGAGNTNYTDAFKLVVKGILFETSKAATPKGQALTVSVKDAYFVQEGGSEFALAAPESDAGGDYAHISVDPKTCDVTIDASAEAGVYPVSIKVTNRTNPEGVVFSDLLDLVVESKPYDLKYANSSVTLSPTEGYTSVKPTVRAATASEGHAVTFSLSGSPSDQFSIDAVTGVITVADDNTLPAVNQTYELNVNVTNGLGTALFSKAFSVTVDPDKPVDPITALDYSLTEAVVLTPGQPWTSLQPQVTGSGIGIAFSLKDAPSGVEINAKTGVITMVAGHHMPLLKENNTLTVKVQNIGMATAFEKELAFSIDPLLWKVGFTDNKGVSLTNSGITNMDRVSFLGAIIKNGDVQVKAAWGKSSTISGGVEIIDFLGTNDTQNNDWLISAQITLSDYDFTRIIKFGLGNQYGADANNGMEVYVLDDTQNVYVKGAEAQEATGTLASVPAGLAWERIAEKTKFKVGSKDVFVPYEVALPAAYKGKKVRFALRCFNPDAASTTSNTRNYRVQNLRVEESIPVN